MTNNHLNNLLFLLAGTSLALGCDLGSDDDDTTTGQSTDGGPTAGDDNMQDTAADDNTMMDTAAETASPDTGDTAGDTMSPGTTAGTGDDATTTATTGEEYSACFDYATNVVECFKDADMMEEYDLCEMYLDYYAGIDKPCLAAAEDLYACLGALDCKDLVADEGCAKESELFAKVCPEPMGTGTTAGTAGG
ncbi:MAG: hypothetical protein AAF721_31020 [Myxococcota bacterium]